MHVIKDFVIIIFIIDHHTGYASNVDNNSTALKSLPMKNVEPSNTCIKGTI